MLLGYWGTPSDRYLNQSKIPHPREEQTDTFCGVCAAVLMFVPSMCPCLGNLRAEEKSGVQGCDSFPQPQRAAVTHRGVPYTLDV